MFFLLIVSFLGKLDVMSQKNDWPHAPAHRLGGKGAFMVTAGTYGKVPIFTSDEQLDALCGGLMKYAQKYAWQLQAWAVFPNHYHFVATSPEDGAENLSKFMREFHSRSARWINECDGAAGRKVWHNYWESEITHLESYYARLHYVHANAVKHGVVLVPSQYRWCSAGWFERTAERSFVNTVYGFKMDRVNVNDDF